MASKMVSFFLAGLYLAGLGLAAPTMTTHSLSSTNALDRATAPNTVDLDSKRTRVFRLDKATWSRLSSKTAQAPKYILDATLGLLETNVDADVVPVFASTDKSKTVIVDADGDLLTTYGNEKFVPVWARPWRRHHRHRFHGALRFSEGLAMFILGFSLSLALVCSYFWSLGSKQDDATSSEPSMMEKGLPAYRDNEDEDKSEA